MEKNGVAIQQFILRITCCHYDMTNGLFLSYKEAIDKSWLYQQLLPERKECVKAKTKLSWLTIDLNYYSPTTRTGCE